MSESTQPFNEENLFIIQNHSTHTDLPTQAAITENVQRHLQQKRRKGEARARGKPRPSWTNFTSVLLLPSGTQGDALNKLSRLSQPANNSTDPFHSTVIGTDAGSHLSILPIIFGDVVRENFLGEAFAPRDMCTTRKVTRHDGALHQRLVQCVHDELLMYATLAYALSFKSWSAGQITQTEDSEYFQLKAIQALQSYLRTPEHPINTSVLLSVYSLAITSGWRSMITKKKMLSDPLTPVKAFRGSGQVGHQIHLSALLQLIQDSGGWHNIDPYVLESIILGDKHASFATGVPPMLRPWWDPGPLPMLNYPDSYTSQTS
ncbi:hypothetical protein FMEXI_13995 [Fusarium mexicanum]|uniref:Uncharacterized protein n=1 Tax=Fusarium mexicanum TaxID=751941 RepID=A0A8H5I3X4_9HYPO|nr:hypothetical protein FMEXI_13995 [Fusarium mexicanum]